MEAVFDPALNVTGWFDPTLEAEGWFDDDFTADTGSGQTVAVGSFSETDSLGPVTMRDQAWVAAVGAENSGTGNVTYTLPAHQADDILLLLIECAESAGVTAPSGWAHITNSPRAQGSNVTTVNVLWKRATSSAETNPTVTDPGNHQVGFAVAIRGADTTGDPWDFTPVGDGGAGATSFSADNGTTTVTRTLICSVVVANTDTLTDQFSSVSMTGVSNFTEQGQAFTDNGNGGGVALYTATRSTAGTPGPCDGTIGTSSTWSALTFAITKAVSGQTVAVGSFIETDALTAAGRAKAKTVGTWAEVDQLTGVGRAKSRTVGALVEADALTTVGKAKSKALGSLAETDALTATTRRKIRTVGTFAEADTLGPVATGGGQTVAVGSFTEADALVGVGRAKSRTVGAWSEADAFAAVARRKTRTVGALAESDALTAVTRAKTRTVGSWATTDALSAVARVKTVTVGTFTEVDALTALPKVVRVGSWAEVDTLTGVARVKSRTPTGFTETDTITGVARTKTVTVGVWVEVDTLSGVVVRRQVWKFTPPQGRTERMNTRTRPVRVGPRQRFGMYAHRVTAPLSVRVKDGQATVVRNPSASIPDDELFQGGRTYTLTNDDPRVAVLQDTYGSPDLVQVIE